MTPPGDPGRSNDEDSAVRFALERGLRLHPLEGRALARVRQAVQAEFEAQYARRRHRRLWIVSIAASLAGVAVLAATLLSSGGDAVPVGVVARLDHGSLRSSYGGFVPHEISLGGEVPIGRKVTSNGTSLIELSQGGALRVAPGTVLEGTGLREVLLHSGRVFLDFPRDADKFVLRTQAGAVEHVGTQFEVWAGELGTRVRVREGSVRMHLDADTRVVEAGTEMFVTEDGSVRRRSISTYGPEWGWVETLAPEFDIENRELAEMLTWVARETGRHIEFADEKARQIAGQTRLHGSIRGLAPLDALHQVMSTTSLHFEVHDDVIRVSSRG